MSTSKIEWTDETINPIVGCTHISPACDHCYAERMAARLASMGKAGYTDVVYYYDGYRPSWNGKTAFVPGVIDRYLAKPGKTHKRIFWGSMTDLFHPTTRPDWLNECFDAMRATPQHTHIVLTKRPEAMAEFVHGYAKVPSMQNLWLGATVEGPNYLDRVDVLRSIPGARRFISFEPLLADVGSVNFDGISWAICGGETGPGARPMHPDWARSLRDRCQAAGVPFFYKSSGTANGPKTSLLDGREWREVPKCHMI